MLRAAGRLPPPPGLSLKGRGEASRPAAISESLEAPERSLPPVSFREGEGSSCVVLGLGMLGLTACAWAEALGITAIACDVSDARLAQAARFGARHLANPDALADLVKSVTHGRGADTALELSGAPEAARASLEVLRVGGTAVWAGAVFPTDPVPMLPEQVIRRCLTVTGVHNYAPQDLDAAVRFLAANHVRFPFAELVAKSFPLADVNGAFRFAEAERPVRVAVVCD
ncbi:hypothetical protein C1280_30455 [Gemmata obscuriglobus]|uniref:Alcohol dehydrogenase-like C-terminal domain-containing protein n=2 Tax=Gemmata obscuriglobus TaxID=114 RepID=A0A2Z3HFZ4_9BACT|nr:hypothetical protein C1280_30455 [Gemmata obscuriglobus]